MTHPVRPLLILAAAALCSCQNFQKSPAYDDPYVSNYGSDGGYHPYPGQPGTAQTRGVPAYEPPPAPVEADPYAFNAPSSSPPRSTSSSSSTVKKPSSSGSSTSKSTPKKSTGSTYKVVSGDTLYGIAKKRGSSVAKIKAANGLKSDLIRPGQTLRIP